ncbi:MAG: hypothetical protein V1867_07975 [Candidatus Falkowbacteria bacterium]
MKYNRFLPLLIPLLVFALLEIFYFQPKLIYVVLVLSTALYFFTIRQFLLDGTVEEKWYNLVILPVYFSAGIVAMSTLVPRETASGRVLLQSFFLLNAGFLYLYLRSIYHYLYNEKAQEKYSLKNLSAYGNFLAFYFLASSVYGLQSFLNLPVWLLMVVLVVFSGMMVYQVIWSHRINRQIGIFYILVFCLIIIELAWSVSFLTLSYYVLGLIVAICYYVLIGLVKAYLLGNLRAKTVKWYLIFGFLALILVLLTARWI